MDLTLSFIRSSLITHVREINNAIVMTQDYEWPTNKMLWSSIKMNYNLILHNISNINICIVQSMQDTHFNLWIIQIEYTIRSTRNYDYKNLAVKKLYKWYTHYMHRSKQVFCFDLMVVRSHQQKWINDQCRKNQMLVQRIVNFLYNRSLVVLQECIYQC